MTDRKTILALSGSTRPDSVNEKIIKWLAATYRTQVNMILYDGIGGLPHFRSDRIEEKTPAAVRDLYRLIEQADAVLICTPEYVFSLPGSMKNALDWTVSTTLFTEKPTGLIVASSQGERAFEALQLIMTTLGAQIPREARLLIPAVKTKVNEQGQPLHPSLVEQLDKLVHALIDSSPGGGTFL